MYCPQCGKENPDQQRYCPSCGVSLHQVALVLAGEPPPIIATNASERQGLTRGGWSHSPVFYALMLIVTGALAAGVFGPAGLHLDLLAGIGGLIALLGVGLLGVKGVLLMIHPSDAPPPGISAPSAEATNRVQPGTLPAGEPPGVTEHTTRSMDPILTDRR
jgi:zinc-ribbon domain